MSSTTVKIIFTLLILGGLGVSLYIYGPKLWGETDTLVPDVATTTSADLMKNDQLTNINQTSLDEKKAYFSKVVEGGGAHQCTVAQTVNGVRAEGIVYINDQKVRGDFTAKATGLNLQVKFISDGKFAYTWTSLSPKGVKLPVKNNETMTTPGSAFNYDDITEYECQAWVVDNNKFTLPTGITFSEVK